LLVDVGDSDPFVDEQLRPELLVAACGSVNLLLTVNRRAGDDHSYYYISTFIYARVRWHFTRLGG